MIVLQILNEDERALANKNEYKFDHPDAFDYELLIETLKNLKKGKSVEIPIYSFKFHRREKQKVRTLRTVHTCLGSIEKNTRKLFQNDFLEDRLHVFRAFCFLQKTVYGANVVIFEGILAFSNKELLEVRSHCFTKNDFGFDKQFEPLLGTQSITLLIHPVTNNCWSLVVDGHESVRGHRFRHQTGKKSEARHQ